MSPRKPLSSEKEFQSAVLELATLLDWRCYHTFDSRRSQSGWPDLVLAKGSRLLFIELKTDKGLLSVTQQVWLNALQQAGQFAEVWRPKDWDRIEAILKGKP